jgi:hypothetical protein
LNHLLQAETAILNAWQQRKPLQGLQDAQGRQYGCLEDLAAAPVADSTALTLLPRLSGPPRPRPEQSGRLQRLALDAAVAVLAEQKLSDRADSPANQLARLDTFQGDVVNRSVPKVQLTGLDPERTALLAKSQDLLWPVREGGTSLRFESDPLLLAVARRIIERHLYALSTERRNSTHTAQRIRERSTVGILNLTVNAQ